MTHTHPHTRSRNWSINFPHSVLTEPNDFLVVTGLKCDTRYAIIGKKNDGTLVAYCNLKEAKTHSAMSKKLCLDMSNIVQGKTAIYNIPLGYYEFGTRPHG